MANRARFAGLMRSLPTATLYIYLGVFPPAPRTQLGGFALVFKTHRANMISLHDGIRAAPGACCEIQKYASPESPRKKEGF